MKRELLQCYCSYLVKSTQRTRSKPSNLRRLEGTPLVKLVHEGEDKLEEFL